MSLKIAISDIKQSIQMRHVWLLFGWFSIKMRYKRSLLGPFWITVSLAFMVTVIGTIYANMFKIQVSEYLPYLGTSLVLWYFISQSITEGCFTFINNEMQIKQVSLPVSLYAFQTTWQSVITMLHNAVIVLILLIIFKVYNQQILFLPLTLALVIVILFSLNIIFGMVSARYRDIPQVIQSIMQAMMFITPVFWRRDFIDKYWWVTSFNPLFHILEVLRSPALGKEMPMVSLYVVIGLAIFLFLLALVMISINKKRIAFWI